MIFNSHNESQIFDALIFEPYETCSCDFFRLKESRFDKFSTSDARSRKVDGFRKYSRSLQDPWVGNLAKSVVCGDAI